MNNSEEFPRARLFLDQDPGWTQTLVIAPDGYPAKHVENAMESHALSRKMAYNCWGKSGYSGFPNFLWQFAGSGSQYPLVI
jgi:hypothetical protein